MTDCDHMTGEKAKSRLLTTPPTQQIRSSADSSAACRWLRDSFSISEPERQISMAVMPVARAPKTTDTRPTLQEGLGWPRNCTKAKMRVKSHESMVQIG